MANTFDISNNKWDACRFFFTEDASNYKGRLIAGLFEGRDAPLDGTNSAVLYFLKAGNYASKANVEQDTTLAHELVDFVAATGDYHKKINGKVIATTPEALNLYNNVFARWNTLSKEAQTFYKMFIDIQDSTGRNLSELEYGVIRNALNTHQFALKNFGNSTKFAEYLPKSPQGLISNVGYTATAATNEVKIAIAMNTTNALKTAYENGFGAGNWSESIKAGKATKYFSINESKFARHLLAEASKAFLEEDVHVDKDEHILMYTGKMNYVKWDPTKQTYFTQAEDPLSGEKKRIDLGTDSNIENLMNASNDCYTTFVNGSDAQCKTWFNECIMAKDKDQLKKCLASLKGQNFFVVAKQNIETMHPLMALQILRQFGFRKHLVYDSSAGTDLWKVESVNHWQKHHLKKHHSTEEIKAMIENPDSRHLLGYLDLVSQFVNSSPAILNKNYVGQSDEALGVFTVPEEAQKLKLKTPSPNPARYVLSPMIGYLINSRTLPHSSTLVNGPTVMMGGNKKDIYGGHFMNGVLSPFGTSTFTPGLSLMRPKIQGSADNNTCNIITAHLKNQGHDIMAELFRGLIAGLKAKGKVLDQASSDRLKAKLQHYQEIQNELLKTLCYTEEYAKAIDMTGDYSQKKVSDSVMQKFGERYGKLYGKYHSMEKTMLADLFKIAMAEDSDADYKKF